MGELRTYRDAYGQTAIIRDEGRGRFPFRLLIRAPGGKCVNNGIYATFWAAKAEMLNSGYCWTETRREALKTTR